MISNKYLTSNIYLSRFLMVLSRGVLIILIHYFFNLYLNLFRIYFHLLNLFYSVFPICFQIFSSSWDMLIGSTDPYVLLKVYSEWEIIKFKNIIFSFFVGTWDFIEYSLAICWKEFLAQLTCRIDKWDLCLKWSKNKENSFFSIGLT